VTTPEPTKSRDDASAPIEVVPIQVNPDGSLAHEGKGDAVAQTAPRPIDYTQTMPAPDVRPQQSQPSAADQAPPAPIEHAQTQTGYANTQTIYTGTRKKTSVGLIVGIVAAVMLVVVAVVLLVAPTFSRSVSRGSSTSTITTDQTATGTYYALWEYDNDVWIYTFILNEDGTGTFRLYLADDESVTQSEVDADDYNEPLAWTQDGNVVTITNPDKDTDTLPDAPNYYTLTTVGNKRVLTPTDSGYKYPSETLYEDWDSAYADMSD